MMYTNKFGVTEQVRFYRQQPRHLSCLQFDFEERNALRKSEILDALIVFICLVGFAGLYASWYL